MSTAKNHRIFIPQDVASTGKDFLLSRGYQLHIGTATDEATMRKEVQGCDAILARNARITRSIMEAEPNLRVIARHGVGVDTVDVEAATELGIQVTNAPCSNSETVAEHVILAVLALSRHLLKQDRELRQGNFEIRNQLPGHDVAGKTLGILGLGRIGSLVARKAALGLGMKVIAFVKAPRPVDEWVELVGSREELFRRADFLSVLLPYTPETYHCVGATELGWMKSSAYLINSGRGETIDEASLLNALKSNKIAGAALDVFEVEPPSRTNPIFQLENVIVTPHSAALTVEAMERMSLHAAQGIHDVLRGTKPEWPVNEPLNPRKVRKPQTL